LNYLVLYADMDRLGLSPADYAATKRDVQVLERYALEEMRKK
jgi:hypothetical protein